MQWALAVIVLSMLSAMVVWFSLDRSHWALIRNNINDGLDFQKTVMEKRELEESNKKLKEQILVLEQSATVDRETIALMQAEDRMIQEELYQLKRELEFYQGVMDATKDITGLNIQRVHIDSLTTPRTYRIKVVLTHLAKDVTVAKGVLNISVEGLLDAKIKRYDIQDIAEEGTPDLSYNFRNYLRFQNVFVLPDGFEPRKVVIRLQANDSKISPIINSYDWQAILSGEQQNVGT
ncbi:MAG: hypothetical protein EPO31_13685 [Gammaproteobacteria bacterium]|jgi:hypothetical protein|nr:MAG: hypothetical protein EPO31_13685 [Gammaproteobacteria bacterium]